MLSMIITPDSQIHMHARFSWACMCFQTVDERKPLPDSYQQLSLRKTNGSGNESQHVQSFFPPHHLWGECREASTHIRQSAGRADFSLLCMGDLNFQSFKTINDESRLDCFPIGTTKKTFNSLYHSVIFAQIHLNGAVSATPTWIITNHIQQ